MSYRDTDILLSLINHPEFAGTTKEFEVISLLARGMTRKQTAEALGLTLGCIDQRLRRIRKRGWNPVSNRRVRSMMQRRWEGKLGIGDLPDVTWSGWMPPTRQGLG